MHVPRLLRMSVVVALASAGLVGASQSPGTAAAAKPATTKTVTAPVQSTK